MEDNVTSKEFTDITKDGLDVRTKIPKILIELLVYGVEKDKERIKKMMAELEKQINSSRKAKYRTRVLWYLDNGEKTIEEKKQWLIENSNCKYYLFTPDNYDISSNYIKSLIDTIKSYEDSIQTLKLKGVVKKPI
jgi:hypothetical protein